MLMFSGKAAAFPSGIKEKRALHESVEILPHGGSVDL